MEEVASVTGWKDTQTLMRKIKDAAPDGTGIDGVRERALFAATDKDYLKMLLKLYSISRDSENDKTNSVLTEESRRQLLHMFAGVLCRPFATGFVVAKQTLGSSVGFKDLDWRFIASFMSGKPAYSDKEFALRIIRELAGVCSQNLFNTDGAIMSFLCKEFMQNNQQQEVSTEGARREATMLPYMTSLDAAQRPAFSNVVNTSSFTRCRTSPSRSLLCTTRIGTRT